eukprot:GHVP01053420.1.p1 GENE.GHVP01053420.1~~GHVP01053420.1.p1  ORF type:complete len:338 (+),score=56.83 GHVP01053420.1:42-1055(+)
MDNVVVESKSDYMRLISILETEHKTGWIESNTDFIKDILNSSCCESVRRKRYKFMALLLESDESFINNNIINEGILGLKDLSSKNKKEAEVLLNNCKNIYDKNGNIDGFFIIILDLMKNNKYIDRYIEGISNIIYHLDGVNKDGGLINQDSMDDDDGRNSDKDSDISRDEAPNLSSNRSNNNISNITINPIVKQAVETVDLYIRKDDRKIVEACIGFYKIIPRFLNRYRDIELGKIIITGLFDIIDKYKKQYRIPIRHVIERLLIIFNEKIMGKWIKENDKQFALYIFREFRKNRKGNKKALINANWKNDKQIKWNKIKAKNKNNKENKIILKKNKQ